MNTFTIKAKLPSLNEYIRACRSNKYQGAKFKQDIEEMIGWEIKQAVTAGKLHPVSEPCIINLVWHESTKRRDVDNIQSSQKFILDALQTYKIIPNDNRKYVKQIYHDVIDSDTDYVEVLIQTEEDFKREH